MINFEHLVSKKKKGDELGDTKFVGKLWEMLRTDHRLCTCCHRLFAEEGRRRQFHFERDPK